MSHAFWRALRIAAATGTVLLSAGCTAGVLGEDAEDDPVGVAAGQIITRTEAEPNNTPGDLGVKAITLGADNHGSFAAGDTSDYWRLDIPYRTYLNVFLGSIPAGSDYDLKLYRSPDLVSPVWSGLNAGNADEIVVRRDMAAGTYYLEVYPVVKPRADVSYNLRAASTAVSRATQWVQAQVPYCGGIKGGSDILCGGTCVRTGAAANPAWDPYRSDCSGFVSWAWGLPAPGLLTSSLPSVAAAIGVTNLAPGDILLGAGHVVLFESWSDKPAGKANILHEPDCGGVATAALVTLTGVSVATTVKLWGSTYTAYRYVMP